MLSGPRDLLSLNAHTKVIISNLITVSQTILEGICLLIYLINSFCLLSVFAERLLPTEQKKLFMELHLFLFCYVNIINAQFRNINWF